MNLWSGPVAVIFAREVLEAAVIIGQYRTLVLRSGHFGHTQEETAPALRAIWVWSAAAALCAVLVIVSAAVPLSLLGSEINYETKETIEGVSKLVASLFIFDLCLKVPKIFGVGAYGRVQEFYAPISMWRLRFDIAWNIWREVAEIGLFLVPSFLNGDVSPIPLSAFIGASIAIIVGLLLYMAHRYTEQTIVLAGSLALATGWLSVALFAGGMHELEEAFGETEKAFWFPGCKSSKASSCAFWNKKKFPMVLFSVLGYSHSPTVLQMISFWLFALALVLAHTVQYRHAERRADAALTVSCRSLSAAVVGKGKPDKSDSLGEHLAPPQHVQHHYARSKSLRKLQLNGLWVRSDLEVSRTGEGTWLMRESGVNWHKNDPPPFWTSALLIHGSFVQLADGTTTTLSEVDGEIMLHGGPLRKCGTQLVLKQGAEQEITLVYYPHVDAEDPQGSSSYDMEPMIGVTVFGIPPWTQQ